LTSSCGTSGVSCRLSGVSCRSLGVSCVTSGASCQRKGSAAGPRCQKDTSTRFSRGKLVKFPQGLRPTQTNYEFYISPQTPLWGARCGGHGERDVASVRERAQQACTTCVTWRAHAAWATWQGGDVATWQAGLGKPPQRAQCGRREQG
jgi:hypothetical protein